MLRIIISMASAICGKKGNREAKVQAAPLASGQISMGKPLGLTNELLHRDSGDT